MTPLYDELATVLGTRDVIAWNDAPERRLPDVIAALQQAFAGRVELIHA